MSEVAHLTLPSAPPSSLPPLLRLPGLRPLLLVILMVLRVHGPQSCMPRLHYWLRHLSNAGHAFMFCPSHSITALNLSQRHVSVPSTLATASESHHPSDVVHRPHSFPPRPCQHTLRVFSAVSAEKLGNVPPSVLVVL
ncbi:hypothetical protein FB45DRAFT_1063407 [Roridomyces roridus]|uniref:Uncharacterized protein n=1 Tax=Roridomyces roridus TaxID=1738132 RepID=A0AAD7FDL5_9AGAR|nr:hypothetical protein FB45DRAFT_1063407 [Roridomyces roridus]